MPKLATHSISLSSLLHPCSAKTSLHPLHLQLQWRERGIDYYYYQNMDPDMYTAAMRGRVDDLDQYSADQFALQLTPNGNTLLHVAAEFESSDCVPAILSKCPSLLRRANTDGDTPIHVALARRWNFRTVEPLIDFAKSEEGGGAAAVREMLRARNHNGDTPLHLAARYGDWRFFKKLFTEEDPGLDHGPNKAGETPLYLYVDRGYDVDVLSQMLKTCTPPEYGGPSGRTALHAAVIRCKDEFIDKLIEWRNDLIKEPDANGLTPLHYAADNGNVKAVQKLLDKDKSVAYITANNDEGNTALHKATAKGHTKLQWRERGIDYYYPNMDPDMYTAAMKDEVDNLDQYSADQFALQVTPNGNTLLHVAAQFNSSDCVPAILSKCPSLLRRANTNGDTPIHVAVARLEDDVVRSLIDFAKSEEGGGAAAVWEMLRARNHDGDTPLHLAARCAKRWSMPGLESMLDWGLTSQDQGLDHGPNKAGETPLYLYVDRRYNDDVDVLSQMLKTCTPPEYGGPSGKTALHAAVIRSKDEFIDKLIEWRNDLIKEPDADGLTPLHYAADNGDVKAVQKLLDKDKSVSYVTANNDEGNTALHMATAKGHTKVMKELLSKCPDCWEMVNRKGRNILHISMDLESDEATKYISEQPWKYGLVNRKDHEGNTPMHVLAHNYNIYKAKQNSFYSFLEAADMEALNNEALTVYDILFHKIGVRKYWLLQKKFLRGLDEKDQGGKGKMNYREQKEQREKVKQKAAEDMGKMAKTHMIVATLISTITFAAGFTIPGGYHGEQGPNQGMAVLVREAAFKAFVISNTIALICSTSSVFLYVSASLYNITGREGEKRAHRYEIAFWLILTAMLAMMLAFSTGAYAVLAHSLGLAIATCVIACSSFIVYVFELKKHFVEEIAYAVDSLSSFGWVVTNLLYLFCCRCNCFRVIRSRFRRV